MSNLLTGSHNLPNVSSTTDAASALEKQLSDYIDQIFASKNADIQGCLGGWSRAWGPSVFVDAEDYEQQGTGAIASATNVMFAAQNGNNYVVAIAGTNSTSIFDEADEDGKITPTAWTFGNPTKGSPFITTGNSDAIGILAGMSAGGNNNTLDVFLQGLPDGSTVSFTGHSLGGGLTPAFATALFNQKSTLNSQLYGRMSSGQLTVQIFPTAAPDIGNQDYVNLVQTYFKPGTTTPSPAWAQWNQKIWNSIDMVPQVWSPELTKGIKKLYGSDLATPPYVSCIVGRALDYIALRFHTYAAFDPNKHGQFSGSFVPVSQIDTQGTCNTCDNSAPDDLCGFLAEVLYQHTLAYVIEFGIVSVLEAIHAITGPPPAMNYCTAASAMYAKNIAYCVHI